MASDHSQELSDVIVALNSLPISERRDYLLKIQANNPALCQRFVKFLESQTVSEELASEHATLKNEGPDFQDLSGEITTLHRWFEREFGSVAKFEEASRNSSDVTIPPETPKESIASTPVSTAKVHGFEILAEIGRGGMGVVYKARQLTLNRIVALKMLLSGSHAHSEDILRFLSEAEAVATLQHPNIVQVYETGHSENLPYMALEFVAGGSLDKILQKGPLPTAEAARLVKEMANGMNAAHQAGIVHRDLKPGNVLITGDGTPKITDFGLAKKVEGGSGLTQTGAVMGTPSYMAPEQASGESKRVGPAADVYALGAILYCCLTGRPPFQANTQLDTLLQVLDHEPQAPRSIRKEIEPALEAICLKCLRKSPQDRYPSANALAEDLHSFLEGGPVIAEGSSRLGFVKLLLKETRHTEVLAQWGHVWMWHAVQIFVLFLLTNILLWAGLQDPISFLCLWLPGLATLLIPIWYFRFSKGIPLMPIEHKIGQVWGFFTVAVFVISATNHIMGLERFALLPLVVLQCGFAFGCMAIILGGSFYGMALACTIVSLIMAVEPRIGPIVFGATFAVGLFWAGWRYSKLTQEISKEAKK